MRQLVLTGLGNEMDLNSGRSIFTAVFNKDIRIEISKEAAEVLTNAIYAAPATNGSNGFTQEEYEEERVAMREEHEQIASERLAGVPELEDAPGSIYEDDTGVEQV